LSIAIWANSLRPDRGFGQEPGEELRGQAKELLKKIKIKNQNFDIFFNSKILKSSNQFSIGSQTSG
jgi:hypothetical protein